MIKIFKLHLLTKKDYDVLQGIIYGIAEDVEERVEKQADNLRDFEDKFDTSMNFIGRNLPLKRKRKAFFKIVK